MHEPERNEGKDETLGREPTALVAEEQPREATVYAFDGWAMVPLEFDPV